MSFVVDLNEQNGLRNAQNGRNSPGYHDFELGSGGLPEAIGHWIADSLKTVHRNHHQDVGAEEEKVYDEIKAGLRWRQLMQL